jgi:hypothetical protein
MSASVVSGTSAASAKVASWQVDLLIARPSPQQMPLKYVQDVLDDSKHRELDDLVLKGFGFTPQDTPTLPSGLLVPALLKIVHLLPAKLDQKYAHYKFAEQLITDFPELVDVLQEAWTSGTFRKLRNLGTLGREC